MNRMQFVQRRGKSYWTKRRHIRDRINEHMQHVKLWLTFDPESCAELPESSLSIIEDEECLYTRSTISENEVIGSEFLGQQLTDNISDTPAELQLDASASDTPSCSHSFVPDTLNDITDTSENEEYYSFSDSSNIIDDTQDGDCNKSSCESSIAAELSAWATNFNITHAALKKLLEIFKPRFPDLPVDSRSLLQTPRQYTTKKIGGGSYYHFGIAKGINDVVDITSQLLGSVVSLQINVDGLPLFKSSKMQFWPILGLLNEVKSAGPFVISLFCGETKPLSVHEYLCDFIVEMKRIEMNGVNLKQYDSTVKVTISCFVCDAPARAYLKQTKGHNAYHGCERCVQHGSWVNKVVFLETDANLRTDKSFDEKLDPYHHTETTTPLQMLNVGLVSQFVLDPMHLVYLGAMKKLLSLWLKAPIATGCRLGNSQKIAISDLLLSYHCYVPHEFSRKCRSLFDYERWKATEFRQFLLYTGIVALKKHMSKPFYKHFLLFFTAIYCLCSHALYKTCCSFAHDLLLQFVEGFRSLYGSDMLVYNVHNLVHISSDVERFGPLDCFSTFPFENLLGRLKGVLRKPDKPLEQIICRQAEQSSIKEACRKDTSLLKGKHHAGPLPLAYQGYDQYSSIKYDNFLFSIKKSNNCVKVEDKICIIRNILSNGKETVFLYSTFTKITDFFTYPAVSSDFGIHKVSELSSHFHSASFNDIVWKYFRLPYGSSYVVIPIVHQS